MFNRSIVLFFGTFLLGIALPSKILAGEKNGQAGVRLEPTLVAQLGHSAAITSVSLSSDGRLLATGSVDETARLWDVATGKELRTFRGHNASVESVFLSGDGKWLVTGGGFGLGQIDKTARLWEVATGKEVRAFRGHAAGVNSVVLSGDGKWLVTSSDDKTARLWEVATGKERRVFREDSGGVHRVTLSSDGKWLVTGSGNIARLWEVATGKEVRTFGGQAGAVRSVALSGDGKWLVAGGGYGNGQLDKTAHLWEVATGKEVRAFRGHANVVNSVALSGDGKWLATGGGYGDKTARLWEVATGKEVRAFLGHAGAVDSVALLSDGKWLVTGSGNTARLWEVATGKEVRAFRGYSSAVSSVSLSGDGKLLVTGSGDNTARLWDLATGNKIRAFQGPSSGVTPVSLSGDGKRLITGSVDSSSPIRGHGLDNTARLWDVATGNEIHAFRGHPAAVISMSLSGDGKWLAFGSVDKTARLWQTDTGKELRVFRGHAGAVQSVSLSSDGKWLVTESADFVRVVDATYGNIKVPKAGFEKTFRLWDTGTGKPVRAFQGHSSGVTSISVSGDCQRLATAGYDNMVRLWDTATGKEISVFGRHSARINGVSLSNDGKWLATGSSDGTARLWEVEKGKEARVFQRDFGEVTSVSLSSNGKWFITGSLDSTTRVFAMATGKELCRLVSFQDGSWAIIDSQGRFDAANGGDIEGLHWSISTEWIAVKQLKERYYEPGLLAKLMGFNKAPLRNVPAFNDVKLHPAVEAEPPAVGSGRLTLKLANRGGGIGKVQVFVNGRELSADARGPKFDADVKTATMTVDLAGAVVLPGEKNLLRVVTWNSEGYLSSRGLDLDWEPPGKKVSQPIELRTIVVGVSDYASDGLKLRFAGKDAADIAKALELGGNRLFKADKTHVTLLCDNGPAGALPPTRANLEKAFEAAHKSRPTDVLVVYLAGHGVALQEQGGQEIYCYLTKEARAVNQDAFRDPEVRRQSAITSAELTEWFKRIPALKQVLILDTCAAGAAAKKLIEHRNVGADQIRAIDRLRDRTGFHVLMGCAADRVSYEASKFSQGVLTYALLQGMRGPGLDGELVDVSKLFRYAEEEVPQLARDIGGIQKPLVLSAKGSNFVVGQLLAADKKLIPLSLVRPLLLRPVLQNADENVLDDDLGLMVPLRKRLSDATYTAARGPGGAAAVYVDADEMPGAVRPTGKYTVEGKTVRVRLLLRQDGQTVATLQVDGTRDDLDALADRLAAAILAKLKTP